MRDVLKIIFWLVVILLIALVAGNVFAVKTQEEINSSVVQDLVFYDSPLVEKSKVGTIIISWAVNTYDFDFKSGDYVEKVKFVRFPFSLPSQKKCLAKKSVELCVIDIISKANNFLQNKLDAEYLRLDGFKEKPDAKSKGETEIPTNKIDANTITQKPKPTTQNRIE